MTTDRVALVALELAAVAIHPYPVGLLAYFEQTFQHTTARLSLSETELEIMLALPMFLRLYLLGRAMMLHSRLFTDTASRSIGALNKVGDPTALVGFVCKIQWDAQCISHLCLFCCIIACLFFLLNLLNFSFEKMSFLKLKTQSIYLSSNMFKNLADTHFTCTQ